MSDTSVVIIGAGLGGLGTAIGLTKVGIPVIVLERSPVPRGSGASINLGTNGWKALDALGVSGGLRDKYVAFNGRQTYTADGSLLSEIDVARDCANGPHEMRACMRDDLVQTMVNALPHGTVRFSSIVCSIDPHPTGTKVLLEGGEELQCRLVVGADGVYSKVARALGRPGSSYAGVASFRGIATFKEENPYFSPNLQIFFGPTGGSVVGMYPLDKRCTYFFLSCSMSEEELHSVRKAGNMRESLLARAKGFGSNVQAMIANTKDESLYLNQNRDRAVQPKETWGKYTTTLIGDAAHPTTPGLGQGGCMALEDGVELAAALGSLMDGQAMPWPEISNKSIEKTLRDFESDRSTRCARIVAMSRQGNDRLLKLPLGGVVIRNMKARFAPYFSKHRYDYMLWDPPALKDTSRLVSTGNEIDGISG